MYVLLGMRGSSIVGFVAKDEVRGLCEQIKDAHEYPGFDDAKAVAQSDQVLRTLGVDVLLIISPVAAAPRRRGEGYPEYLRAVVSKL